MFYKINNTKKKINRMVLVYYVMKKIYIYISKSIF